MDEQQGDPERREGVSTAAWAALGTVGAAVVAGIVTLVTVYLPAAPQAAGPAAVPSSGGRPPQPATAPASATAEPTTEPPAPQVPRSSLLVDLTGRWQGKVTAEGQTFTMILDIPDTCAEGMSCGTMTTDLHGCVGDLVLVRINDGPQFDLATVDFHEGSSASCELRPGGGDYFTMGREVLVYATGYDGSRSGTLRPVG